MKTVQLLPIDPSGTVSIPMESFPDALRKNCEMTATFYKTVGFAPPWVGYVALSDGKPVGLGAFKGAPRNNRTEIAYFTLPEFEGRGFATASARELIRIAREANPTIVLTAQTLPVPNASNTLLQKLGFVFQGMLVHPEDGEVWEWQLNPQQAIPTDGAAPALAVGPLR